MVVQRRSLPCLYRSDKKVTSFITKHMPAELVEGLQTLRCKESQATPLATPSAGPSPAHSGALPALPSTTKISAAAPHAAQAAVDDHSVSKQELRWSTIHCHCVSAPMLLPMCHCPCATAPELLPLCHFPSATPPVLQPLCHCPCANAPVPLRLCHCLHASSPVPLAPCFIPCATAPEPLPLCHCPCASVHVPLALQFSPQV